MSVGATDSTSTSGGVGGTGQSDGQGEALAAMLADLGMVGRRIRGFLGGDDPTEFGKQLDLGDFQNQMYALWCGQYDKAKLRSGDVWDEPNSIYKFRNAWAPAFAQVDAMFPQLLANGDAKGREAVIAAGKWNSDMSWSPPRVSPGGTYTSPGSGGPGGLGTPGSKFEMLWPWQKDALKIADWRHWLVWSGAFLGAPVALWYFFIRKPRKTWRR